MEIDWTVVAFEALNFGVLVLLLKRFLFRPVAAAIETRRKEIESHRAEVDAREAAANAVRQEYETKQSDFEKAIKERADAAATQARHKAGEIIEAGRGKAKELVAIAGQECQVARARALEQLRLEVFALAVDAAGRVIRHMGDGSVARAYARKAAHTLQDLLEEVEGLSSAPIEVSVGDDADPDEMVAQLREILGPKWQFAVRSDPEIIAGARLEVGSHEVEASASSSLRDWYDRQIAADGAPSEPYERAG